MKQNVSESETVLSSKQKNIFQIPRPSKKKYFSDSSTETKKNIFIFLDRNKKKYFMFLDPKQKNIFQIPQTRHSWPNPCCYFSTGRLFSAGRLFYQQKVGHGNETKCFGIRNNSLIQTKHTLRFLDPNKKKIFLDSSTQTKKNIFRFLDPNKKKFFLDSSTQTKKKYFQIPQPKRGIFMTKSLLLFSAGRLFQLVDCFISSRK